MPHKQNIIIIIIIMLGKYSEQTKDSYCFCSLWVVAQLDSHIEFKYPLTFIFWYSMYTGVFFSLTWILIYDFTLQFSFFETTFMQYCIL